MLHKEVDKDRSSGGLGKVVVEMDEGGGDCLGGGGGGGGGARREKQDNKRTISHVHVMDVFFLFG